MYLEPPKIESLNDVLPIIKDNPAFIVVDKGWYTVVDYVYTHNDLFKHPIERECRGLKFCTKTKRLIARPYHKFFNLNEREETKAESVDFKIPHMVLDKLDGSMVHTCLSPAGGIYLMTRMGCTDVADQADAFLMKNQVKYSKLFTMLPLDEYTFIFEYVGPHNKIVIDYKEDMILTGIRNTVNGTYVFHDEMVKLAKAAGVPVVDAYTFLPFDELPADNIADDNEKEGVVVRFDTGAMLKVKSDIYVRRHRAKDLIRSPKDVLNLCVKREIDDIIPQLDKDAAGRVFDYQSLLMYRLGQLTGELVKLAREGQDLDQKDFALSINHLDGYRRSMLFRIRKFDNPVDVVFDTCAKNSNKTDKFETLVSVLELPVFKADEEKVEE